MTVECWTQLLLLLLRLLLLRLLLPLLLLLLLLLQRNGAISDLDPLFFRFRGM